jgi:hypothetical protein
MLEVSSVVPSASKEFGLELTFASGRVMPLICESGASQREWLAALGEAAKKHTASRIDKPVIESWLSKRDTIKGIKQDTWSRAYVRLFDNSLVHYAKAELGCKADGIMMLTSEFYVADANTAAQPFGFIVSGAFRRPVSRAFLAPLPGSGR